MTTTANRPVIDTDPVLAENWMTVAVTALPPGWVNVYSDNSGHATEPCPAILMQESTLEFCCWDEIEGDRIVRRSREIEHDRVTRVVYAASDNGELDAANDVGNYVTTTTAEQWAAEQVGGSR